mgnify:CR=1 FL=1
MPEVDGITILEEMKKNNIQNEQQFLGKYIWLFHQSYPGFHTSCITN